MRGGMTRAQRLGRAFKIIQITCEREVLSRLVSETAAISGGVCTTRFTKAIISTLVRLDKNAPVLLRLEQINHTKTGAPCIQKQIGAALPRLPCDCRLMQLFDDVCLQFSKEKL